MKSVTILLLCVLVLATNGCTVLGVAADLAILSALDDDKSRKPFRRRTIQPYFTEQGIKHDIQLVKNLMAKLPEKQQEPISKEVNLPPIFACSNALDDTQQCYPPEYYKDMYITDSDNLEKESALVKD